MRRVLSTLALLLGASPSCGYVELNASELSASETGPSENGTGGDMGVSPVSTETPGMPPELTETLTVAGRYLRDHCGKPFVMRGITEMVIWSEDRDGVPEFAEIAKTGANAGRIVWLTEGEAGELDRAISSVRAEGMVAVLDLHDDARDLSHQEAMDRLVSYFTRDDVRRVVMKHQKALVVELQVRKWPSAEPAAWEEMNRDALARLREAGLRIPLAIKEPTWDDEFDELVTRLQRIIEADGNAIYVADVWNGTAAEYRAQAEALIAAGIPSYLSEFSGYQAATCPIVPTEVTELLQVSEDLNLGWFAWSWGGVKNEGCDGEGYLDISSDGTVSGINGWGLTVTTADPNGLTRATQGIKTLNARACEAE